jgi:hypothetical protein
LIQVQSGRKEAPCFNYPPGASMFPKISVFSATIKARQICLWQESCTIHIDSQIRWSPQCKVVKLLYISETLQYSDVFWATFLPEAYLPDFDSCTKYTDFWKHWSTGGIVEAGASILLDWSDTVRTGSEDPHRHEQRFS